MLLRLKISLVFGCIGADLKDYISTVSTYYLPDYIAEFFEISHDFADFTTFAEILLNFHKNC